MCSMDTLIPVGEREGGECSRTMHVPPRFTIQSNPSHKIAIILWWYCQEGRTACQERTRTVACVRVRVGRGGDPVPEEPISHIYCIMSQCVMPEKLRILRSAVGAVIGDHMLMSQRWRKTVYKERRSSWCYVKKLKWRRALVSNPPRVRKKK
jgi:hypothetical protein